MCLTFACSGELVVRKAWCWRGRLEVARRSIAGCAGALPGELPVIMHVVVSAQIMEHVGGAQNSGAWFRSTDLWVMSPTR